jgi:1-acyl-sn-glycerol-3-phosphate acyltransferase
MFQTVAAACFLVLVLAALLVWAASAIRRSPYTVVQTLLWPPALVLVRMLWRAKLPRGLPLAPHEGAVLVSNHRSSIDPFFVQVIAYRDVHWMVAKEYCDHPAFGWFLRIMEVIPTNRGGIDTAATKLVIRYLKEGKVVGMFPEGRINMTDELLLPARPGAAMAALKAGVPIVPCYIEGSPYDRTPWSPFFMSARVRVRFGDPIDLSYYADRADDREVQAEIMQSVMQEIARLAGRNDFQPRLAGKRWKPTAEELEADMAASVRRRA